MKEDGISIDIDNGSKFILFKTIKQAIELGFRGNIRVFLSPSHHGYRIKLPGGMSKYNNIQLRALLNDDPFRMRFSIKREALGNSNLDIAFDWKEGSGFTEEITNAIPFGEIDNITTIEELGNLADNTNIPVKPCFMTIFETTEQFYEDTLKTVLEDIKSKDPSFRFSKRMSISRNSHADYNIVIYSPDKDTAHKRGMWFKHKGLIPEVSDFSGYWVKEMKIKRV